MSEVLISELFQVQERYVRSVNLERDFEDASSLEGYVVTPQLRQMLERLQSGLDTYSTQRAWRITGDYGSGKSSFALLLANLFSERRAQLPSKLLTELKPRQDPRLLPVLVTGSREPLAISLLRAVARGLHGLRTSGPTPHVLIFVEDLLATSSEKEISTHDVVNAIEAACYYVARTGKSSGLLIILDELGKPLEFSALHPERQDVYLLQALAESAARSGQRPIYVIGLLHQGFNVYAESLSQAAQKEWEKVAGRFDELIFSQHLDQVSHLIAEALKIKYAKFPSELKERAEQEMEDVLALNWYGASANRKMMLEVAKRLYPLHPSVVPVLVRVFSKFGQNERSLFSFLLSNEPHGLQEFASRTLSSNEWFRLSHLYDYTRATFGYRLGLQSYRSHWNQIDSVVQGFPVENADELELLKTVGLLNLLDSAALPPSLHILKVACAHAKSPARWKASFDKLERQKRVLYFRGKTAGYCLWPHTSVNLESAYQEACAAVASPARVSDLLKAHVESRPIVARRHYIQTGNLRHFNVVYVPSHSLVNAMKENDPAADGRILIVLCDSEEDRRQSLFDIAGQQAADSVLTLAAVPRPLIALAGVLHEVQKWEWISTNTPGLNHDRYAANEVSNQLSAARLVLSKMIREFVGLHQSDRPTDLQWFQNGGSITIRDGKELLTTLSRLCDEAFPNAPEVRNELINRRQLSSAAAAARMRLIERIFTHPTVERLGMPAGKAPPEYSMYLSVLVETGLHRKEDDAWKLQEPGEGCDPQQVRPAFRFLLDTLRSASGRRVRVSKLVEELRKPPYGIRDGLAFLFLAILAQSREQDLAFYENGSFMRSVGGEDFLRIVKDPSSFELQFYEMNAVRSDLYRRLSRILSLPTVERGRIELLDVVRPLCQFATGLPLYTQKTHELDHGAQKVRAALMHAREPATLLFEDLPAALSFTSQEVTTEGMEEFVQRLRLTLEELRSAFPELIRKIGEALSNELKGPALPSGRKTMSQRARALLVSATEARLKSFCLQLADDTLGDTQWLEALASLVCSKPAAKWLDRDVDLFLRELAHLATSFLRLEALLFSGTCTGQNGKAYRVAITQQDGQEIDRVMFLSHEHEPSVDAIHAELLHVLKGKKAVGEAALAKAFWQVFSPKTEVTS